MTKETYDFLFWYMTRPNGRVYYVYITAVSAAQASYFFRQQGYCSYYDYCSKPIDYKANTNNYKVGTAIDSTF